MQGQKKRAFQVEGQRNKVGFGKSESEGLSVSFSGEREQGRLS